MSHGSPVETSERTQRPDVSIIIPTRNRFGFLIEAIDSVRAQTVRSWEAIIVDDASDDGSAEAVAELVGGDPRLHLVALKQRSERSGARNTGIAIATGRYVLFLDDDDLLAPKALKRLAEALDSDDDAVVAIGARRFFDSRGHKRRAPHPRLRVRRRLTKELLLGWVTEWVAVPGQCLIRTQPLRDYGGWNATLVGPEDQELLLRLTRERPAVLIPQVVLEYRLHANQWRPPDVGDQEEAFRREIASRLEREGESNVTNLLRAGGILRQAGSEYRRSEYRRSLKLLIAAARTAPDILRSPIVAPPYLHACMKSFVGTVTGPVGARAIRNVRERVRQQLRRSPDTQVTVLLETTTLPGRNAGYQAPAVIGRETDA